LLKVISMGFLSGEDEAIMWRGLMLNRAVQHFLEDVRWGALDYLVIDLPPGTGDVQMGLARMIPRTEVIVVTTPNKAAQSVAGRAADMARRGHIRVAGVIENMSALTCEHGQTYEIFGSGGGQRLADQIGALRVDNHAHGSKAANDVVLSDLGVEEHLIAVSRAATWAYGHAQCQAVVAFLLEKSGYLRHSVIG
jgi:Mrp family chromosome partitioning ATPase